MTIITIKSRLARAITTEIVVGLRVGVARGQGHETNIDDGTEVVHATMTTESEVADGLARGLLKGVGVTEAKSMAIGKEQEVEESLLNGRPLKKQRCRMTTIRLSSRLK
jgi:hypothetical protein